MLLKVLPLSDIASLGVGVFRHEEFTDQRGSLRLWFEGVSVSEKTDLSLKMSSSRPNVGRGLHWQGGNAAQTKLITVLSGEIYDFLFDPNQHEALYAFRLSSDDRITLTIPPRFAHGFITLTRVDFMYCCVGRYDESRESTFRLLPWAAQTLNLPEPQLSAKDQAIELGLGPARNNAR